MHNGTLTMEFDGDVIKFNIYDAMQYPDDVSCVFSIDIIEPLTQKTFELSEEDKLKVALCDNLNKENIGEIERKFLIDSELQEVVFALEALKPKVSSNPSISLLPSNTTLLPSVLQPPKLDLKPLPIHLKYAFLGAGDTLPVIISNKLSKEEEDRLIEVLKSYKEAVGWTIAYIKGISPSTCMHRILL